MLLQKLSRQGLHSTALELGKLLMALDPTDPMGVFCWVDYLALRAHRFTFLQVLFGTQAGHVGFDSGIKIGSPFMSSQRAPHFSHILGHIFVGRTCSTAHFIPALSRLQMSVHLCFGWQCHSHFHVHGKFQVYRADHAATHGSVVPFKLRGHKAFADSLDMLHGLDHQSAGKNQGLLS